MSRLCSFLLLIFFIGQILLCLPVSDLLDLGEMGRDVVAQGSAPLHLTARLASEQRQQALGSIS